MNRKHFQGNNLHDQLSEKVAYAYYYIKQWGMGIHINHNNNLNKLLFLLLDNNTNVS